MRGNGIMHIKLLVTEQAYAFGSYNWTRSATTLNDEILEIGTDRALRQAYENIFKEIIERLQRATARPRSGRARFNRHNRLH